MKNNQILIFILLLLLICNSCGWIEKPEGSATTTFKIINSSNHTVEIQVCYTIDNVIKKDIYWMAINDSVTYTSNTLEGNSCSGLEKIICENDSVLLIFDDEKVIKFLNSDTTSDRNIARLENYFTEKIGNNHYIHSFIITENDYNSTP